MKQIYLDDERELLYGQDPEKALMPRENPDDWHELDYLNISFIDRMGNYMGSIEIEDTVDGKIPSLETVKAIEIFASISSIAIELVSLKANEQTIAEAAEKRSAIISRILNFVRDMLEVKDPKKMFDEILNILRDLFGFQASSIVTFDEVENCFKYASLKGYSKEEEEFCSTVHISPEQMIVDKSPEFLIAHDVSFIPGEKLNDEYLKREIQVEGEYENLKKLRELPREHQNAWHPLDNLVFMFRDRRSRIMGLLYPDLPSDGLIPSVETVEAISIYVSLVAIALENAKQYSETLRTKEDIELLNRILFNDVTDQNKAMRRALEGSLERKLTNERRRRYLKSALEHLDLTIELIQKVRKLSQIRTRDRSSLLRLDLIDAVRNQVQRTMSQYSKRKVSISYDNMPEQCYVLANDMISELFDGLISNAIIHSQRDEVAIDISVDIKHDEFSNRDYWEVKISDNGQGIPDNLKNRIFDISSQFRGVFEKSGLGLAIVKSLAELYNGSVHVEDRISGDHSQGALFRVRLPAA